MSAAMLLFTSPAILVDSWFPASESASAYAISGGSFTLGNLVGIFVPSLVVRGPLTTFNDTGIPQNWANGNRSLLALNEVKTQLLTRVFKRFYSKFI